VLNLEILAPEKVTEVRPVADPEASTTLARSPALGPAPGPTKNSGAFGGVQRSDELRRSAPERSEGAGGRQLHRTLSAAPQVWAWHSARA
jgi:hypothetical protein